MFEKEQIKTENDQEITFTIKPLSLKNAVVDVLEDPTRLINGKAEPRVKVTVNGIELPEGTYTIKYSNNTKKGKGTIVIVGDGVNIVDESVPVNFTILPDEYTITYDLNGGTYDGKTGKISETYEDGEWIRLLDKPTKEGYVFDYWKGSKYKARARYMVSEDHTFTAQWRKPDEPATEDTDGVGGVDTTGTNTGDDNQLALYIAILLAALAGMISAVWIRKTKSKDNK